MSGAEIGILLALVPVMQFFSQPFWGFLSDIGRRHRQALVIACFGLAAILLIYWQVSGFTALLILTIIFAVLKAPIDVLITALALEQLGRQHSGVGFGSLRLWGSIGFSLASFGIGAFLIDSGDYRWIIPLYALCNAILGLIALTIPDADIHEQINWRQGLQLATKQKAFQWFLVSLLLLGMTFGIYNNYFTIYLTEIEAAGWVIGAALALSAIFEVPFMLGVPAFIRRWGIRLVLVIGVATLPVRWLLYLLIDEPLLVLPVQGLHSMAMMSLLVVGILYMDRLVAPALRASGQAVYAASFHGIGPGIGLYVGGVIFGRAGIGAVWLFSLLAAALGLGLLLFAVYGSEQTPISQEAAHEG